MDAEGQHNRGDGDICPAPALFDDVIVYADPDDIGRWLYLPLAPSPVLSASGAPSGQLIAAGETTLMMLSAQWGLPDARLERLRGQIQSLAAASSQDETPAPVRLAFAPVRQVSAALLVLPEERAFAHSATSGIPPWSALFNGALDAATRPAAIAAFNGNEGHVAVEFSAHLAARLAVGATLEGDLAGIRDRAALDRAIGDRRARVTIQPAAAAGFAEALMDRLIEVLRHAAPVPGASTLISADLAIEEPVPVRARADLGRWFAGSPAILPAGSTSTEGRKAG
jgi:hypothetical protein